MRFLHLTICPGWMNYDRFKKILSFLCETGILVSLILLPQSSLLADEQYSFKSNEFEKTPFEWGGYFETKWEHINVNKGSAFASLNLPEDVDSSLDHLSGSMLIGGKYKQGITSFTWQIKASGQQDELGWQHMTDIFQAYASINPTPQSSVSIGKKSYKWGKGYAWNSVGFINRPKAPNDPEEALEGYTTLEAEVIKSFSGSLQNAAATLVALPVLEGVNEDFGEVNNINLAAKLSLLYQDTDIDFIYYTGNSRSTRVGGDFSRNIGTNFEIHGEIAYVPSQRQVVLLEDRSVERKEISTLSGLFGCRYLSTHDTTSIIEYYYNGLGYSERELNRFYQLVDDGIISGLHPAHDNELNISDYARSNPGRNYLYVRMTQKEPFDILYLTPRITTVINLDNSSSSITPEIAYTGFTNWEVRLRFSFLNGDNSTEYGEKQNQNKLELRIRYFF